jgi:SAM-dependent methyltransferase
MWCILDGLHSSKIHHNSLFIGAPLIAYNIREIGLECKAGSVRQREVNMKPLSDPEGAELSHLLSACSLEEKTILEIGCGKGNLVGQYASLPGRVVGIDPAAGELLQAKSALPGLARTGALIQARAETLPFGSETFDIAFFASSL